MPPKNDSNKIVEKILSHPDKDEILVKLIGNIPSSEINEWLEAKYQVVNERKFVLSKKEIDLFRDKYLDIYSIIKDDLAKTKSNISAVDELQLEIQGSQHYHKALEKYIDTEIDIKTIVRKLVINIETRASQIFDILQNDPENFRNDRVLIEWFNTLTTLLEKYDTILNGNPDQINIQNNINIQVVDNHINVVYNLIKDILYKLDYDTSLLFIEMFNEAMKKLKTDESMPVLPQEIMLDQLKETNIAVVKKLEKQ